MNSSLSIYTYACTRLGGMKNAKNVKKPKPLRSFTLFMFFTLSGRMHACGPSGARLAASRGRGSFLDHPHTGAKRARDRASVWRGKLSTYGVSTLSTG